MDFYIFSCKYIMTTCNKSMKGGRRRSRAASRGRSARRSRSASRGRSARRSRAASRGRRGGMGASEWQMKNVGPMDLQISNANNSPASNALLITHADGSIQRSQADIPAPACMKGGRKRKGRGKKGGFLGQLINQALVPFGLLGMQHAYGKRSRKHRS